MRAASSEDERRAMLGRSEALLVQAQSNPHTLSFGEWSGQAWSLVSHSWTTIRQWQCYSHRECEKILL